MKVTVSSATTQASRIPNQPSSSRTFIPILTGFQNPPVEDTLPDRRQFVRNDGMRARISLGGGTHDQLTIKHQTFPLLLEASQV